MPSPCCLVGDTVPRNKEEERPVSLFNGTWKIDIARSRKWDPAANAYVADEVGEEIITLRIGNGVQDYEVLYGNDPVIRMGYTSRHDDPTWVPYAVREIITPDGKDQASAVAAFRDRIGANDGPNARNFRVGQPYGLVRTVYVDERTHYRIAKAESGAPQNVMLRRMAEDGQSYVATVLDADGVVSRVRRFVRAS
jgi:hypothetical protein